MIRIEIQSTDTTDKRGTGKKSGKAYSFKEQAAWAYIAGEPFPTKVTLTLNDNDQPHAKGMYTLAPESLFVADFGQFGVKPKLLPVKA